MGTTLAFLGFLGLGVAALVVAFALAAFLAF
jgi:hypothetical protein